MIKNSRNPAIVAASGMTNLMTYGSPGLLMSHNGALAVEPGVADTICIRRTLHTDSAAQQHKK